METVKENKTYLLGNVRVYVRKDSMGWYIETPYCAFLDMDLAGLQKEVLGYEDYLYYPHCKNAEDLTKFMEAVAKKQVEHLLDSDGKHISPIFKEFVDNYFSEPSMTVTKTKTVTIQGHTRDLTIAVCIVAGKIRTGYSVRDPNDEPNEELAKKIATGRAMSDRTNLTDMVVGKGMDKKFILYAVADWIISGFERGVHQIKGIK